jgi:DNA invertase Pin-like site-specific DNA recombinase
MDNMNTKKKRVYGYIRVSTETQAEHGFGLDTQRNAIIKYCNENNFELVKIFSDEGISGAMGDNDDISKRQGLCDLLDTLNGTNTIVVLNKSRLWRDDAARVYISRKVRSLKGEIISIEEPRYSLYSKDPQEFIFNSMMEMLDQYDRLCINMKLAKGRATKARKGNKPAGRLPYGYDYTLDGKSVIINKKEAKIVKMIFELAKYKSYQKIANILNSEGYKTKQNNKWCKATIAKMINNDFYIGIVTHAGEKIIGNHKNIISKDIWNKIHG